MVLTLRVTYIKENLGKIVTSRNFKYSEKLRCYGGVCENRAEEINSRGLCVGTSLVVQWLRVYPAIQRTEMNSILS